MTTRFVEIGAEDRGGGFDLFAGNHLVLRHRVEAPAIHLARGAPSITMVRGNFRLDDDATDSCSPPHATPNGTSGFTLSDTPGGPPMADIFLTGGHGSVRVVARAGHDRISIDCHRQAGEICWGGGEQMSYLTLNGRRFPFWTSEPGVGREPGTALTDLMNADGSFAGGDYWTTNYPEPTMLSSRGIAVALDTTAYSEADCTDPDFVRWTGWTGDLSFDVYAEPTPAALVNRIGSRHGPRQSLPDWSISGAIVGLKDGENSFARLEKIISAGAAVSGLWCEDWCGIRETSFGRRLFWDWQWNADRYPDLPTRVAALKERGIRFLGYVNPYLAVDGPQYAEAARLGFLARQIDGDEPCAVDFGEFDAGVVDFTNPDAAAWFSEEIIGKQMIDLGLDGWMADFGEYLPVDLRLHSGDPMTQHNRWPVHWAKVNADALSSRGRTSDALFFMRAGFAGIQKYCPLLWAGDQSVDFSRHDGIGTVITAALSAGLLGNLFSHSDVGGYTSLHGNVRTAELMHRWFELGAFTPVMRTHEGNRPDDNLQIDSTPELLTDFARWSRVHAALAPWVRHLCSEASVTGLPAQRALFLHYPDDQETFTIQDQYLYGADLMVAPVIEEGATSRRVYLPGDSGTVWRHLWSGADCTPGWHMVAAPLGAPPVYYRPDSSFAQLFASLANVRDSL